MPNKSRVAIYPLTFLLNDQRIVNTMFLENTFLINGIHKNFQCIY